MRTIRPLNKNRFDANDVFGVDFYRSTNVLPVVKELQTNHSFFNEKVSRYQEGYIEVY